MCVCGQEGEGLPSRGEDGAAVRGKGTLAYQKNPMKRNIDPTSVGLLVFHLRILFLNGKHIN